MANLATVILAAGKGTRMKSDLPKVLHPLNNKPMISYVVDTAEQTGSQQTVLVIGHKKELVMDALKDRKVAFSVQEVQLGTGHAVMQAREALAGFDGNILVLSGDVPLLQSNTLRKLIDIHQETGSIATLLTTYMDDPSGYGRILRDDNGQVVRIVEEKDANEEIRAIKEINVGIYVFKAAELFSTLPHVKNDNRQGEYYLPDVLKIYVERGEKLSAVVTEDTEETHGINTVEQLKHSEQILDRRLQTS